MKLGDIKIGEVYLARWDGPVATKEQPVRIIALDPGSYLEVVGMTLNRDGSDRGSLAFKPEEIHYIGGIPMAHVR